MCAVLSETGGGGEEGINVRATRKGLSDPTGEIAAEKEACK